MLLYELLLGQAPFHGKNESEVFQAILASRVAYPSRLDPEAKDLIQQVPNSDIFSFNRKVIVIGQKSHIETWIRQDRRPIHPQAPFLQIHRL